MKTLSSFLLTIAVVGFVLSVGTYVFYKVEHKISVSYLDTGKEYRIKQINVISGSDFGVLVDGSLYFVKLYQTHATENAKVEVAQMLQTAQEMTMVVRYVEGHDIFVDMFVMKEGLQFNLRSWLKEKGLAYEN